MTFTHIYHTVSAAGRAEIATFLKRYHKRSAEQSVDEWVEGAEANLDGPEDYATLEISSRHSLSGHLESLTLRGDSLVMHKTFE